MDKKTGDYYFNIFLNLIRATYMNIEKDWESLAKESGLTHAQQHALWILNLDDSLTLDQIQHIGIWNKSTVSALISRLEKKGYVQKEKYLENSRIIKIYITEQGRKILHDSVINNSALKFMGLFNDFDISELETFLDTFKKISRMVNKLDYEDFENYIKISSENLLKK
ncbi:MarR family transcriptional regulator [Clostridium sp.]|uniref:MarR family winged helix-turn-helix transcriptional regulator n=1 Tax=Clostridium sp. TaxID=1506 RepID=UPI001A600B7E|nr:MarR family transcriptional regulator [Clostridium sp.]MBK5237329.1 MarR family transcriptional regulator [Clostridium sp.]